MPIAGFKCRICGEKWPLEGLGDAAYAHMETAHGKDYHLNRRLFATIAKHAASDATNPRRNGTSFTASMAGGCMRQYAIERTEEMWPDPLKMWLQAEGSALHRGLEAAPGWANEYEFPETELWPGVKVSGVADDVNWGERVVRDLKTHGAPYGQWERLTKEERAAGKRSTFKYYRDMFPPGEQETLQVNLLCRLAEFTQPAGVPFRAEIVPLQKGVKDPTLASPPEMPVERMDDAALEARVRPQYEALYEVMSEPDLVRRRQLTAKLPLEGRTMYKRRDGMVKCDFACEARQACDALLPEEERF